jgi:hypothetical protein
MLLRSSNGRVVAKSVSSSLGFECRKKGIAEKVSIVDRPLLVVAIVTTAVVVSPLVLAYFGILHY